VLTHLKLSRLLRQTMTSLCNNVDYDSEEEESYGHQAKGPLSGISDTSIRHGFVQKVYGILTVQLLITTAVAALIMHLGDHMKRYNPALVQVLMFCSMAGTIGVLCLLCCRPDLMRKTPQNYMILSAFTICEAILVGFVCVQYTAPSVLFVTGITGFVVFGLTLFACQTTFDFTGCGPYLFAGLMVLMGFGFCLSIASWFGLVGTAGFETLRMIYAAGGALLFSFYIVYDTQLIVGGKHKKHQFEVDDYCFAALNLYLDIINLFLFLLELFGDRR